MITVFGSINVDLVTRVERTPAPGETVHGSDYALIPGGKGANQALAAAPRRRRACGWSARSATTTCRAMALSRTGGRAASTSTTSRGAPAPPALPSSPSTRPARTPSCVAPGANAHASAAGDSAERLRRRRHAAPADGGAVRRESCRRRAWRARPARGSILSVAPYAALPPEDMRRLRHDHRQRARGGRPRAPSRRSPAARRRRP